MKINRLNIQEELSFLASNALHCGPENPRFGVDSVPGVRLYCEMAEILSIGVKHQSINQSINKSTNQSIRNQQSIN